MQCVQLNSSVTKIFIIKRKSHNRPLWFASVTITKKAISRPVLYTAKTHKNYKNCLHNLINTILIYIIP